MCYSCCSFACNDNQNKNTKKNVNIKISCLNLTILFVDIIVRAERSWREGFLKSLNGWTSTIRNATKEKRRINIFMPCFSFFLWFNNFFASSFFLSYCCTKIIYFFRTAYCNKYFTFLNSSTTKWLYVLSQLIMFAWSGNFVLSDWTFYARLGAGLWDDDKMWKIVYRTAQK